MPYFETAKNLFNERYEEVKNYLIFVKSLKDTYKSDIGLTRDSEHIFKSNVSLMQYNLLESSFLEIYKGLYAYLQNSNLSLDQMNSKFICYTYGLIRRSPSKKYENLKGILQQPNNTWSFSRSAVFTCFELDEEEKKFLVNGNLDGRKIREFIENWGIDTSTISSLDLTHLKNLKDNRQMLAHGGSSFSDVGKDISWDALDLTNKATEDLFNETINLLTNFIQSIQNTTSQVA